MAKNYLDYDGLLYFWQKLKATFALINHTHTKSQISDFPTTMTPSSHTHGNIQNGGTLQTTDVAIANGDKLVITDSSNSSKVARASITFDGSTATKALTQKGTFESFNNYTHPSYTAKSSGLYKVTVDATGHVSAATAVAKSDITTLGIPAQDTTYSDFTGATSSANGTHGLVPAPSTTQSAAILRGNGNWTNLEFVTNHIHPHCLPANSDEANNVYLSIFDGQTDENLCIGAFGCIDAATTSTAGVMSAEDKTKLDKLVFDSSNLIDSSILPSYVDDVIEAYPRSGQTALSSAWLATGSASGTVITPETGKIYVLMADSGDYAANTQFRWGGTSYVKLADGGVSSITNAEIDTIVAS